MVFRTEAVGGTSPGISIGRSATERTPRIMNYRNGNKKDIVKPQIQHEEVPHGKRNLHAI